ncbi:MAG: hypothetical protein JRN06_10610 [Nitrososphaerota archaeon]|nr:hypothetical protein [Nitrososphaerota archaeon]
MERKKVAILALVGVATVILLAGSAYAMSSPNVGLSSHREPAVWRPGAGPMMNGASDGEQAMVQYMRQGMLQNMLQHMQNYSGAHALCLLDQHGNNHTHLYEHEYLWSNPTGNP